MKEWLKAAAMRAIRTFAQSALAYIGTGALVLNQVDWLGVLSAGALGAVISFLMAMAGLPEVPSSTPETEQTHPPED